MTNTSTALREDTPESLEWQSARDVEAAQYLHGLVDYESFRTALVRRLADGRRSPVRRAGDGWFQDVALDPNADLKVVAVRSAPTGAPRVLVDPNDISAKRGVPVSLAWAEPSPDGKLLAYGIQAAGTEIVEATILDVDTGDPLPLSVPWNVTFPVSWLPDSSGFWCSAREIVAGEFRMPVYRFLLTEPAPSAPVALPEGLAFSNPRVSRDGRWIAIETGNTEPRVDYTIDADGVVHPLLLGVPGGAAGRFVDDDFIAIVDGDAPRGRLVRIPVATASDRTTWTELVGETDDVLRVFEIVSDRIVLGYLRDATTRLRVLSLAGETIEEIALPGEGTASIFAIGAAHPSLPMFAAGGDEISFVFSTFTTSPAIYRYDVAALRLELVEAGEVSLDGLTVTTIDAVSADGTVVPAHVVHRSDLDLTTTHPTLIHGYGGFNLSWLPAYLGVYAPWVEAGGVFVLPHLRGGSEYGAQWWLGGMRERKQATFDDLYAVAEELIRRGLTTAPQSSCQGESNGGLLAAAAVAQRPDLFAAVVVSVPICDLLGMTRDPVTYAIGRGEYGDPNVPEEAAWLRALSPFHNVKDNVDYPATLFIAGANDPRCPAWHARSMAGRVLEAQAGSAPILLRVLADQGHGASGLAASADQAAEWLAFVAAHTGLSPV